MKIRTKQWAEEFNIYPNDGKKMANPNPSPFTRFTKAITDNTESRDTNGQYES